MLPSIYIIFSAIVIILMLLAYRSVLQRMVLPAKERSKKFLIALGFILGWISYLAIISLTGILKDLSFPPKFPILILAPLIIGFLAFYRKSKLSSVIRRIPSVWPVYFQSFRIIVELILLYTYYKGIIPKSATFEGFNFDLFMGLSSPFFAYFIVSAAGTRFLQYIWHFLGIIMVLFVGFIISSSMYIPEIWGSETSLVNEVFLEMPYLLLAGFLAPLAIFMHILSLVKLRQDK